jgi:two-component system nitrate/nitrite response regulator NarL
MKSLNSALKTKAATKTRARVAEDSIGVMVIDDHAVVRAGLHLLLEDTPGVHPVGEVSGSAQALAELQKHQPAITLLELNLGDQDGIDLLPELLQAVPYSRVIILTGSPDTKMHRQAIVLGARGLVMKSQDVDVLLKAIRRVHAGELWIDRALMHTVIGEMTARPDSGDPEAAKIAALTARELEIVAQIGEGLKNKQIAERLFISETTVRHHLTSIFSKLGVGDRLELVIYAYRHNLACIKRETPHF